MIKKGFLEFERIINDKT